MSQDLKILLIGGNFKNKGAEAMVLTISRFLQNSFPNCEVTLASYANEKIHRDEQGNAVVDSHNTKIKIIKNKKKILQIPKFLLYGVTKNKRLAGKDQFMKNLFESDVVIDVSGFALSDDRGILRQTMYCVEIIYARIARKPFIANSQAFGPFSSFFSRMLAKIFLHKVDLLNVRGKTSLKHIKKVNKKAQQEAFLCMDSAFSFEKSSQDSVARVLDEFKIDTKKNNIAIIPNINIYKRLKEKYIIIMEQFCRKVLKNHDVNLVFICHEFYDEKKDDKDLIKDITKNLDEKERIIIINKKCSAAMLKAIVGEMDLALASRYHAIVASISVCTPVIVIGWAHKYKDLLEDVGLENCLIEYQNVSTITLYNLFTQNWQRQEKIKEKLVEQHGEIVTSSKAGLERIKVFIEQKSKKREIQ